jgi:(E)-4-hydroxy-3-methylbut-2-enyl-diphosphate synthase
MQVQTVARKPRQVVRIGDVAIGGDHPIAIQSMTKVPLADIDAILSQIREMAAAGCEIARVAVPGRKPEVMRALAEVVQQVGESVRLAPIGERAGAAPEALPPIPIVADIHYDWRIAEGAAKAGVAKLRINPGNIGDDEKGREVARVAREYRLPVRVGANSGSIRPEFAQEYGIASPEALVESALHQAKLFEDEGVEDIVISVKAAHVPTMIAAYRMVFERCDYPLHLGVTESGFGLSGETKTAVGLGTLLAEGIGDTVRVSLTEGPVAEVRLAQEILQALEIRRFGPNFISCPGCGRLEVDHLKIACDVRAAIEEAGITAPITIAVMGCTVNGMGEAPGADIGVCCFKGRGQIFVHGKKTASVPESEIPAEMLRRAQALPMDGPGGRSSR